MIVPPVIAPVTLTAVPIWVPAETLAVVVILLVEFSADTTFELRLNPAAFKLPPVILPLALNKPVMYSPVGANTTTFDTPPTPIVILPPELTTVTFEFPLLILATDVITPVSKAPLPKI